MHASCDEGKGHAFRCVSPFSWWFLVRFKCACNSSDYWQPSMGLIWYRGPSSLITTFAWKVDASILINEFPIGPLSHACSLSRSGLGPSRAEVGFGSRLVQPKVFKKWLYLVASKLSLEVVSFCKTQANSGDLSATMFLSVFVFSLAFSLGLGIYYYLLIMLRVYVVFVAFSWGETFLLQLLSYQWLLYVQLYLATTVKLLLNCWLLLSCCRWLLPNCCWIASELLPLALRRTKWPEVVSHLSARSVSFRFWSFLYLTGCWFEYCFIAVGSVLLTWFYLTLYGIDCNLYGDAIVVNSSVRGVFDLVFPGLDFLVLYPSLPFFGCSLVSLVGALAFLLLSSLGRCCWWMFAAAGLSLCLVVVSCLCLSSAAGCCWGTSGTSCDMQVSKEKCITLYNQAAQSTQTVGGEHARNASPETEAK